METDPEEPKNKRKRNSKSRGGYRFPMASKSEEQIKSKGSSNDIDILSWIMSCGQCCGKVPEEATCCLLQHFKRKNSGEYRFQVAFVNQS